MPAIEAMPYNYNPDIAKDKMLKAEGALREYFDLCKYDAGKENELTAAVKLAQQEFVDKFETLFPQI